MIREFEWVCPGVSHVWCIRRLGEPRMLCGASFFTYDGTPGFVPVERAVDPSPQCQDCVAVMYGGRRARPVVETGVCPACEGLAPVAYGRVEPHGVFRVSGGVAVETSEPCVGVNMRAGRVRR